MASSNSQNRRGWRGKIDVGDGPPFSSDGRGTVTCSACDASVDADERQLCSECGHMVCPDCADDWVELERVDSQTEQAETQEDNVPQWCGGPQIKCLARFIAVAAVPAVPPQTQEKKKRGPKPGAKAAKAAAAAAKAATEDCTQERGGEDEEDDERGTRGRAATNDYWKEEVDGVRLILVLKDDRIRDKFINKDLHHNFQQLDSKQTDAQAMWSEATDLFNDPDFQPANPFPGDSLLRHVDPAVASGRFDTARLQKHLGQMRRRRDRSDQFWLRTGNGEPDKYHEYCFINPQSERERLAAEDGEQAMPPGKGGAGRRPKFLADIYILHRFLQLGGDVGPFLAKFTNQAQNHLRRESGLMEKSTSDETDNTDLSKSFDSYTSDLSTGERKRTRDERNAVALQKAQAETGLPDKEQEACVAAALAKERTMKAAKKAEDLRAEAEGERYEQLLIESIQKLEDQMDPQHSSFRTDPTGMWARYLEKKRQQLLALLGNPSPPSPGRLTPRGSRASPASDAPFHAPPPVPAAAGNESGRSDCATARNLSESMGAARI